MATFTISVLRSATTICDEHLLAGTKMNRLSKHALDAEARDAHATHGRSVPRGSARGRDSVAKRGVDLVVGSVALAVLSPLCVVAAIAIVVTMGRPIIFRQERVGRHQWPFTIYKFRTMVRDNDDSAHRAANSQLLRGEFQPGPEGIYKLTADPRITPVGQLLRRFSFDEVPQIVNVIKGDMSLVGPRPALQWEVDLYEEKYLRRLDVRPGLTGLWQVRGRNLLGMREMLDLDVEYATTRSMWMDLKILARTPAVVLTGRGAR